MRKLLAAEAAGAMSSAGGRYARPGSSFPLQCFWQDRWVEDLGTLDEIEPDFDEIYFVRDQQMLDHCTEYLLRRWMMGRVLSPYGSRVPIIGRFRWTSLE